MSAKNPMVLLLVLVHALSENAILFLFAFALPVVAAVAVVSVFQSPIHVIPLSSGTRLDGPALANASQHFLPLHTLTIYSTHPIGTHPTHHHLQSLCTWALSCSFSMFSTGS